MANLLASGPRIFVYLNSTKLGRCNSFSFSPEVQHRDIYCLDSTEPFEIAVNRTSVSGRFGFWRTPGDGGVEGLAASAFFGQAVLQKYNTIRLVDRKTKLELVRIEKVVIAGQNWEAAVKELMRGTVQFRGILYQNEHPRG